MNAESNPPVSDTTARAATARSRTGWTASTNRVRPRRVRGQASRSARSPSNPRSRATIPSTETGNPIRSARRLSSFRRYSAPTTAKRADGDCLSREGREILTPFDFHQTHANKQLESGVQPEYHYFPVAELRTKREYPEII